jgi:hypothetical protein
MKKQLSLFLLFSLFGISMSLAQSSQVMGITSHYVKLDSITLQGDSLYDLLVTIHLTDTLNVSKVHISVGEGYGSSTVHQGVYNWYDSTLSLPSIMGYKRQWGMISFTLNGVKPSVLYYQATVENFQSNIGTPYIRQH